MGLCDRVHGFIVTCNSKAFNMLIFTCRWEVWPCVLGVCGALCAVGVGVCERPKDVCPMVTHVLSIAKFKGLYELGIKYV